MVLSDWESYIKKAKQIAVGSKYIYVSTFGITDKQLEFLNNHGNARVIVGTHFRECVKDCEHCRRNFKGRIKYYEKLRNEYKNVNFKFVTELHLKCFITAHGMIVGGMNYTGSQWDDLAFLIKDGLVIKKTEEIFKDLWANKEEIDVEEILSNKKINNKIINGNILNFGKYKGRSIEWLKENDGQYLTWCKREKIFE